MKGRHLALGLLAAIFLLLSFVIWLGMTGGGTAGAGASTSLPSTPPGMHQGFGMTSTPTSAGAYDGGKIAKTIADKKTRDDLRQRLLQAWAAGDGESAQAAKQGHFEPAPAHDGAAMDPDYIQSVFRQDMLPMAKACYEELVSRHPKAEGRVEMAFKIVADPELGGIVEDASIDTDGGIADEKMNTCMRESLSTLAFRPPANGGVVTVVYPIEFSPGDDE